MNLYEKLKELETTIANQGPVVFTTPYGKTRKILRIENGKVVYEHQSGRVSEFDIDLLYRDYLLLQDVGFLTADMLRAFNQKYTNGKKPCNITTFMLLMNYFYNCQYTGGKKNSPAVIIW